MIYFYGFSVFLVSFKKFVFIGSHVEETGHGHGIPQALENMLLPRMVGKHPGTDKSRKLDEGPAFRRK